jgi:hypothetical protein
MYKEEPKKTVKFYYYNNFDFKITEVKDSAKEKPK